MDQAVALTSGEILDDHVEVIRSWESRHGAILMEHVDLRVYRSCPEDGTVSNEECWMDAKIVSGEVHLTRAGRTTTHKKNDFVRIPKNVDYRWDCDFPFVIAITCTPPWNPDQQKWHPPLAETI